MLHQPVGQAVGQTELMGVWKVSPIHLSLFAPTCLVLDSHFWVKTILLYLKGNPPEKGNTVELLSVMDNLV